ncbi:basic proline-rich protein-like isoform X1 [Cervus canadensis]|uniref:basic proline-rich protein-like isoform X1 n=1 Tax=Cervus canadensis TaxID=1574408 RepID=UPI001CA3227B|nr:basic proline-rich protein-like isoform X1 [Cervus canadensis]
MTQTTRPAGCPRTTPLKRQHRPQAAAPPPEQPPRPRGCRLAPPLAPQSLSRPTSPGPARPGARARARPHPPCQGRAARARHFWAGPCSEGRAPPPFAPPPPSPLLPDLPPRALSRSLCSSGPRPPAPSHGGLALGVPHLPRFLLGHSCPERVSTSDNSCHREIAVGKTKRALVPLSKASSKVFLGHLHQKHPRSLRRRRE